MDANLRAAHTREKFLCPIGASVVHRIGFLMVDTLMAIATWRHSVGDNSSNFFSAASYTLTWSIEGGLIDCDIYHSSAQWPARKPTDVCSGSKAALTALKCDFRCAPGSGRNSDIGGGLFCAMNGSDVTYPIPFAMRAIHA